MPLAFSEQRCNGASCRALLDVLGDHRAACPRSGRLRRRAPPMERMVERIFREAGARVRRNVRVRDLTIEVVDPRDERRIEVIVDGLPLFHGAQLAVDCTLVCALRRNGQPRPGAAAWRP